MAYQVTAGRFVGRTQELAWLGELLARTTAGEPLVVLLGGEAGVGKTRLADQLASMARGQGVRVLGGGCVPLGEEGLPFAPVIQALRGLAGDLDAAELQAVAGPARAELGRLLPDLAWASEAAAGAAGATGAGQAGQGRLFALLLGVVERLAARVPLLWIMEDLHWADRSTRDLLAFLATYLRSGPVMLVLTFRSDELDRRHPLRGLLGELARNRRVVRLELGRFSRAELAEQLAGLLGDQPPTGLLDDIDARSGGNPFFAEELVLAGEGADPRALPPSLREVLLTRLVRLGDRTQQLLRVAAAAGPGATQPLLAAVAGLDDQQLLEGLREAVDQQLLQPGGEGYVFRHALLAEAVYSELLPGERVRLHTALASALEAGPQAGDAPAARAARLAHHWAAAGDQPRALTASIQAASAAEGVSAFAEAQLQLERALALWDQVPDAEGRAGMDRVALLARCAEAASAAGDFTFAEARRPAEEAIAIAAQVGAVAEEATAHATLGGALIPLGEPDAGLAELAAAAGLATQTGDVIVVLRTLVSRSDGLNGAGRPAEAVVVALDGIRQARRLGLVHFNGSILACNATEALFALGRWDQAEQVSRQALETAPSGPAYNSLPVDRAALELGRGDLDAAQARLQAIRRLLPGSIPRPKTPGRCLVALPSWPCGAVTWSRPSSWWPRPCPRWRPTPATPRRSTPWACVSRPTLPSWPAPATPTSRPPTTAPPPRCWTASPRPPPARPVPASPSWPPGRPPPAPSGPASRVPPTRPPGRPRPPPGSGWASPTGPPTPASARPRRCWPPQVTATPPRWCCAAPPPSPAGWAPAHSTARSRPWRGVPAWTSPSTPPPRRLACRPPPSSSASRRGRSRCWRWWRPGAATARSPRHCSSAPRPSASTSPTSSPSWASPAGWRPPRSPTAWAWTEADRRRVVVEAVAGCRSGVAVAGAGAGWSATAARDWWASGSAVVLTPRAARSPGAGQRIETRS
jgi:tetratricopeptide (TPR) repeat protein